MKKIYYGSLSDKAIDVVGEQIAARLGLAITLSDAEDTWEYATYRGKSCSLNISKTDDTHTIKTWMKTAPDGINYQFILSINGDCTLADQFEAAATEALGHSLAKYDESVDGAVGAN